MFAIINSVQGHDPRLLAWAFVNCVFAVWASVSAYRRATEAAMSRRGSWIAFAAVLLGAGVWSTRFLGMLAFEARARAVFHLDMSFLALFVCVSGLWLGIGVATRNTRPWSRAVGGAICGLAIIFTTMISGLSAHAPVLPSWRPAFGLAGAVACMLACTAAMAISNSMWRPARRIGTVGLFVFAILAAHILSLTAVVFPSSVASTPEEMRSVYDLARTLAVASGLLMSASAGLLLLDRFSALSTFSSLQAALDYAPSKIACFDRDNRLMFWNEGYARMLKLIELTAHRGLPWRAIIENAWARGMSEREIDAAVAKSLLSVGAPRMFSTPDGREIHAEGRPTAQGGFVVIYTDITEITALTKREAEARKLAEAASEAKSVFLANMSHEIRTPLNGVLGMVQIMQHDVSDPIQRDRLAVISDSGEALLTVLNNVLDLSKIEAGRLEIDVHPFDLEELASHAVAGHEALAVQKDISVRLEVAPQARGVWLGDGAKLRQVLSNLISNAIKFSSRGAIVVRVGTLEDRLCFEVEDSGIGIPADKLEAVFESFTQADTSTTRQFGGTGLGLSICRSYVHLMGGEIGVTSQEGAGSKFSFALSLERGRAPAASSAAGPALNRSGGGPPSILVVEDNRTNQLILRGLLTHLPCELTIVDSGRQAIAAFEVQAFDVVLMDIQMPDMNGMEATSALRDVERRIGRPRTPIIALTANVMRHQTDAYLSGGMDGFVAKPIKTADLFGAIGRALTPLPEETRPGLPAAG